MGVFDLKTIVNVSRTSVVRTCLTSDFIMDRTAAANGCMMSRWRGNMGTVAPMPVPANRWRFRSDPTTPRPRIHPCHPGETR